MSPQTQASILHTSYTISQTDFRRWWPEGDANFNTCVRVCIFLRTTRSRAFCLFSMILWPLQRFRKRKKTKFLKSSESKNTHLCWRRQFHVLGRVLHSQSHDSSFNLASIINKRCKSLLRDQLPLLYVGNDVIITVHLTLYSCEDRNK